jgi:hypothetical protein
MYKMEVSGQILGAAQRDVSIIHCVLTTWLV